MALTKVKADGLTADLIDETKLADNSIDSEHYNDGSIDNAHLADDAVGTAEIADDAVTGAKIADDAVGAEHIEVLDSHLQFVDSAAAKFGTGNDMSIYHNGTNSYISNDTGDLILGAGNGTSVKLQPEGGEDGLTVTHNGSVELYYDNVKTCETRSEGIKIIGGENGYAALEFHADEGDDNADKWLQYASTDGMMNWQSYTSGSWVTKFTIQSGGGISFNGDSAAANALDDYEEGSFSPGISSSGASLTVYSCKYTKIGREVTIHAYFYITDVPNNGNDIFITGLPFSITSDTSSMAGGCWFYSGNLTDAYKMSIAGDHNTSTACFFWLDGSNSGGRVQNNSFTGSGPANTRYIGFKLFYYTD